MWGKKIITYLLFAGSTLVSYIEWVIAGSAEHRLVPVYATAYTGCYTSHHPEFLTPGTLGRIQ